MFLTQFCFHINAISNKTDYYEIKLLLLFLCCNAIHFSYANTSLDVNITLAERYKEQQKYTKAISYYIKAIKPDVGNEEQIRSIYFDIADCFYKSGKRNMAIKVLKFSIYRYGTVKEDILNSPKLDKNFFSFVLRLIEDKYDSYRNKYVSRMKKNLKLTNDTSYAVKPF